MDWYTQETIGDERSTANMTSSDSSEKRKSYKTLGTVLSLLAICSLAAGVADVALSALVVCKNSTTAHCPPDTAATIDDQQSMAVLFSYIASGIWGSLAVFIAGILSIRQASEQQKSRAMFTLISFLATFVFIPAMLVFNVIEAYWIKGGTPKTFDENDGGKVAKFITPIVIAALALFEFLVLSAILLKFCTSLSSRNGEANFQEMMPTDEKYLPCGNGGVELEPSPGVGYSGPLSGGYGRYPVGGAFAAARPLYSRFDRPTAHGFGPYAPLTYQPSPDRVPIRRNPTSYLPPLPSSARASGTSPYGLDSRSAYGAKPARFYDWSQESPGNNPYS